jgi:hypothetical protein
MIPGRCHEQPEAPSNGTTAGYEAYPGLRIKDIRRAPRNISELHTTRPKGESPFGLPGSDKIYTH